MCYFNTLCVTPYISYSVLIQITSQEKKVSAAEVTGQLVAVSFDSLAICHLQKWTHERETANACWTPLLSVCVNGLTQAANDSAVVEMK